MTASSPDSLTSESEARRTATDAVATLVHAKNQTITKLLEPSGIPTPLLKAFLNEKDAITGKKLSKRQAIGFIFDELEKESPGSSKPVVRAIIQLAAQWKTFELANDEMQARAAVERAKATIGPLLASDANAIREFERAAAELNERRRAQKLAAIRSGSLQLVYQFDDIEKEEPHKRGYGLQILIEQVFSLHGFAVQKSFLRNEGAEQIDGAFSLEGWHYIVECRWRKKLTDGRDLDGLSGQLERSGNQTMGLFLSMGGWSDNVVELLKQNRSKNIILMDGYDLRTVLDQAIDFKEFIRAKLAYLNLRAEPFLSISSFLAGKRK